MASVSTFGFLQAFPWVILFQVTGGPTDRLARAAGIAMLVIYLILTAALRVRLSAGRRPWRPGEPGGVYLGITSGVLN